MDNKPILLDLPVKIKINRFRNDTCRNSFSVRSFSRQLYDFASRNRRISFSGKILLQSDSSMHFNTVLGKLILTNGWVFLLSFPNLLFGISFRAIQTKAMRRYRNSAMRGFFELIFCKTTST